MTLYRDRAKPFEAIHWLGEENCKEVFEFLGMIHPEGPAEHLLISMDGGDAEPGDWIIRCREGAYYEFLPMSDDFFQAQYEEA